MKIEELLEQAMKKSKDFDPEVLVKELAVNHYLPKSVGVNDIRDKKGTGNYCWFPGFIELLKPKMVVELGSAMGVGTVCMLASFYKDFDLYGVTLAENGLEFCYVKKDEYPNFHPLVGDYMDLSIWPKDVELSQTDFWYIDGLHEGEHVREQLLLYQPFFKEGTIIAFDDVFINTSMEEMWSDIENIIPVVYKTTLPLHYTGWGIIQIGKK